MHTQKIFTIEMVLAESVSFIEQHIWMTGETKNIKIINFKFLQKLTT
jgi:hypothetical protein